MSMYYQETKVITFSYDVGDDAREKQALLMLVGALLL